jgi:short-subunit dehydrogenase
MEKSAERTGKKRALVTGASEGIGRVFALRLSEEGYAVTVVARNGARLESLLKELAGEGHRKLVADLSTAAGVASVVAEIDGKMTERYALLVNNAGVGGVGDFSEQPIERVREMIGLNVSALVELSHAYLKGAARGDGIIQVSSTLSFLPMPAQPVYSATKAFVTAFSEALWFQNRKKGVHVLNLCPGATRSLFTARAGGKEGEIPNAVIESPEEVVDFALRCYSRKFGPTAVSGWKNRFFALLMRILTRKQLAKVMGTLRA